MRLTAAQPGPLLVQRTTGRLACRCGSVLALSVRARQIGKMTENVIGVREELHQVYERRRVTVRKLEPFGG
jgi:hypothetical protein